MKSLSLTGRIVTMVCDSLEPLWYAMLTQDEIPQREEVKQLLIQYYSNFESKKEEIIHDLLGDQERQKLRDGALQLPFAVDYQGLGISPRSLKRLSQRSTPSRTSKLSLTDQVLKMLGIVIRYGGQLIPLDPESVGATAARVILTHHGARITRGKWSMLLPKFLSPNDGSDLMGRSAARTLYVTPDYFIECVRAGTVVDGIGIKHAHLRPLPYPLSKYPSPGTNGYVVHARGFGKAEDSGILKVLKRVGCKVGKSQSELTHLIVKQKLNIEGIKQVTHYFVKAMTVAQGRLLLEDSDGFVID